MVVNTSSLQYARTGQITAVPYCKAFPLKMALYFNMRYTQTTVKLVYLHQEKFDFQLKAKDKQVVSNGKHRSLCNLICSQLSVRNGEARSTYQTRSSALQWAYTLA